MKITEKHIEETISIMEAEGFEDQFVEEQSDYWNYMNSEGFKGLSEAEHQMLFFVNSVIYHTCVRVELPIEFDIESYQEYEEDNWSVREAAEKWTTTLDSYFKDYEEEDLLAFVEDMLVEEEIRRLSDIGKEVILITAKSYIDLLSDLE